jgi:predicted O-methyltransferase YrrM
MAFIDKLIDRTLNGKGNSDYHTMTIFSIALQIKAKKILELGVYHGATSEPLVWAASLTKGHLTSVDNTYSRWDCPEDLINYRTFVQEDSIKFLKQEVKKGSYYDLVYIDDWHEYSHVKHELMLIEQITDNKSVIILHDLMAFTEPQYHLPLESSKGTEWGEGGPTRAIFELDKNKWEWVTIPINNGLTILRQI